MMEKIWFITGVSGGFGKCIAAAAAERGDMVAGTVRKKEQLKEFNDLYPGRTFAFLLDVTRHDHVEATVNEILKKFGRIDVLVNNAGYGLMGAIEEVSMEEAREQMETNFFGALMVTKAVLPCMRAQRSGHIVQISSVAGLRSSPGFGLYNASKHALEGFSEALALETSHLNIKVTLVEPGPFRTQFAGSGIRPAKLQLDDYNTTAGAFRKSMDARNGIQDGDPQKAARLIYKITTVPNPPLRLPLGRIAIDSLRTKLASMEAEIKAWEESTSQTSFDNQ